VLEAAVAIEGHDDCDSREAWRDTIRSVTLKLSQ
jgi:hypothetical protein